MLKLLIPTILLAKMLDIYAVPLFADQSAPFDSPSTDNSLQQANNSLLDIFHMEKRPRHSHDSCGCPYLDEFEDFGTNSFPRYHKVKKCDNEKIHQEDFNKRCHYGAKCREFHHEIWYLVPMESEGLKKHLLPEQLNRSYGWVARNIAIDCRCGH